MSEPFLGEIKIFPFNFAPRGWALCNGQLLPINQNQALFSLLGTMYGGDGRTTFALPNLQGRTPIHVGNSSRLLLEFLACDSERPDVGARICSRAIRSSRATASGAAGQPTRLPRDAADVGR